MLTIRKAADRGHANFGWLDTHHSFSFGRYSDPDHMGFRALRVINDDWVEPGAGFGTHPHNNMEIISVVLEGALEHKDSMGNGSIIRPGDVQRMSAGTGITHSEFNHSDAERFHLYQIWILPEKMDIAPSYEQKHFPPEERQNRLRLVVSPDGQEGSVSHNQQTLMYVADLDVGKSVFYDLPTDRHAWVQVTKGTLTVNGEGLQEGDGASTSDPGTLTFEADTDAAFILFDLA